MHTYTKQQKAKNLEYDSQVIEYLSLDLNYEVTRFKEYHFRLSLEQTAIDIYPPNQKYQDRQTGEYLFYDDIEALIHKYFDNPVKKVSIRGKAQLKIDDNEWHNKKIFFGKYYGMNFSDIPHSYLRYIYENNYCAPDIYRFLEKNEYRFTND